MTNSTIQKEGLQQLSQTQILQGLLNFCQQHRMGFAAWKEPGDASIYLIIDDSRSLAIKEEPLESLPEGFIFSPFDRNKQKFFIEAKVKINVTQKSTVTNTQQELTEKALQWLEEQADQLRSSNQSPVLLTEVDATKNYHHLVEKAVDDIKKGSLQKVVPSRFKKIGLSENFNPADIFIKLTESYQNSFVSLVFTPQTNTWLGSSPELLINTQGAIFKTVALAGTQAFSTDQSLADVAWTQKEIEEQALVSRYIINCFKKIRLREFEEIGPKTVAAGNLIHLKTIYTVDMEATNFPQLGSVMLELLHPTSAICGMPLENALHFINEHEDYDRAFFSGYLGPVNIADTTSIYVNLRCMQINGSHAYLYAGAGITEDSVPEKEWKETEMKMNTLLNVIKN
ncbi:MAG: chorismate-binding protein [Fulvivirga sp.]|nr:chorismate-binding protein [Fulvivirga sp.]